ncbi:MAG: 2-oxo acid dehydrogenase subunit E2 [Lentisphaerae bacterium]|nr:2-oxo acid dehydrogenase subunit E2 [Lentisphaerota bacterium]
MATAVIMPRQGQSVESCILVEWLVATGAPVKAGQPVASIETDKAVFEIESPADGTMLAHFFTKGADIPVLTTIAAIGAPGEDVSALQPAGSASAPVASGTAPPATAAPASTPVTVQSAPRGATPGTPVPGVSPRARRAAANAGLDPQVLAGTGPGGRVIERDVQTAAAAAPHLSPAARDRLREGTLAAPVSGTGPGGLVLAADLAPRGSAPSPSAPAPAATTDLPLTGIRKIIAERMRHSLASTAQLTLNRSIDASAMLEYRRQVKAAGESFGLPNITLNDMIVFAVARTLARHPALNAHALTDRITRFAAVHVGVATDTPRGLMVPVLRNAQTLTLSDVSRQLKPILAAAQAGSISPDALKGGTFTITNMGMLGIEHFTPILNAPEVAILGVGGLVLKPVERDGAVRHTQCLTLSLTIDHQALDGGDGARFLQDLAGALENLPLIVTAS